MGMQINFFANKIKEFLHGFLKDVGLVKSFWNLNFIRKKYLFFSYSKWGVS